MADLRLLAKKNFRVGHFLKFFFRLTIFGRQVHMAELRLLAKHFFRVSNFFANPASSSSAINPVHLPIVVPTSFVLFFILTFFLVLIAPRRNK